MSSVNRARRLVLQLNAVIVVPSVHDIGAVEKMTSYAQNGRCAFAIGKS